MNAILTARTSDGYTFRSHDAGQTFTDGDMTFTARELVENTDAVLSVPVVTGTRAAYSQDMENGTAFANGVSGLHAHGFAWGERLTIVKRDPFSYGTTRYIVVSPSGRHGYAY